MPNLFQSSITPLKPNVLSTERIYVYVPEATYTTKGIASFNENEFAMNDGHVQLNTDYLSASPFTRPSLIQLNNEDFVFDDGITSLNWTKLRTFTDERIHLVTDPLTGRVEVLERGLAQEIIDRGNADTALGRRIDDEITNRQNADTALGRRIDDEITNRQNADTALGRRIDDKVDKVVGNYEINNSTDGIKIAYEDEYFKTGVTVMDWLNGGLKLYSSEKMVIAGGGSYWETIEIGVKDIATKSDAVGSIELSLNSTTYVLTLQAKNVNGENIGTAQTIDLPLESIVSSATYYNSYTYDGTTYTKVIVITLSTTDVPTIVPVGDLVSGLQSEITSSNKLSADLVDDTNTTNKFVTTNEKNTWNAKQNALTAGSNITISDNVISAIDTTYSAGTGLTLSGTEFSVDNTIERKPTDESYTIASNSWTALSSSDPYTYSATVTATYTIGNDTEVGIVADQPVLFANYGFVVGAVSGQNVTIYALEQPETSVTLSVSYRG